MTKEKKEKQKKDPKVMLLDLIIVVMIFVMIAVGVRMLFYLSYAKDHSTFMQDAGMMSFELGRNDYASLIAGKYYNEINGNEDARSYHAFADYVEALSMYKIYDQKGPAAKAEDLKENMERARTEMGELTVFADRVDSMFDYR